MPLGQDAGIDQLKERTDAISEYFEKLKSFSVEYDSLNTSDFSFLYNS